MTTGNSNTLGFTPAIKAGLAEMSNLGTVVGVLLFAVFLFFILRNQKNILVPGLVFIFLAGLAKAFLLWGPLDYFFAGHWFGFIVGNLYLVTALISIGIGFLFLRDWRIMLSPAGSREKIAIKFPVLIVPAPAASRRRKWGVAGCALLAGVLLSVFQSVWPLSGNALIMLLQLGSSAREPAWFLLFFVYVFFSELPLLVLLSVVMFALASEQRIKALQGQMTRVQIVLAAIFLGYGISFLALYGHDFIRAYLKLWR